MKFETRHASHPSIIPTANSEKLRELYIALRLPPAKKD